MPSLTLSRRDLTHKTKTGKGRRAHRRFFPWCWVLTFICIYLLAGCASSGEDVTEEVTVDPADETALIAEDNDSSDSDGSDLVSEPVIPQASNPAWLEAWQTSLSQTRPPRTYRLGQIGPAGGIVFYDKGQYSEGWRYLEAAPPSMEFSAEWSSQRVIVDGTDDKIGSGKYNTMLIVNTLAVSGETETHAAKLCQDMVVNGYADWFLPSLMELDMMYDRLKRQDDEDDDEPHGEENIGRFVEDLYWSSSEIEFWGQNFGVAIDFSQGNQSNRGKALRLRVRPVRTF
jgi:hypothetical protein